MSRTAALNVRAHSAMRKLSRTHRRHRKVAPRRESRRLFLESLEPRQMLTSVPVALHDPLYSTAVNTDLVISTTSAGIVNNDFDADGNSLSASVVANPANGSLVSFNSNGTFTYRPNTSFTGIDTFTYKVSDGTNDSNVASVSIAVGGNFGPRTNLDAVPQNAMQMTGALTLSQPLTLGHELVYRSDTVDPYPIVVLETSLLSSSSVPDSIDAKLTFNGVAESTVSYTNTGLAAGDALRFVLKANASSLATGYYDWSIELKAWFGSNSYTRNYTGSQAVVNRSSSEYGKGWWMDGLDQLYANSSGALLVRGNGDTLYFKSDGSGGYLKAPGDTSFSTLVKNVDNTYTLTTKYGDKENFSTTGLLTSRVDTNDNTVSYTYTDADGDSVTDELWKITDPFSRVNTLSYTSSKLTGFQDLASRTTTLAHTSGKLTSVTHPDPDGAGSLAAPVTEYSYDATTALLTTRQDALDYNTTFSYDSTSRRLTSIGHPNTTTWSLTAQQTIGLATGSGNTIPDPADAIGTYTDERSKTWSFKTDRFGNFTYFKDPLNNVSTVERDATGRPIRLTEADPDGAGSATSPITKFGYNSSGDLVKQYLPDGNDLEWTYNSLHRVLTQTNELNHTWEFTYDSDGNMTAAEDPLGNTTSHTVNSRGQVTAITTPDPDGAGSLSAATTEFAYSSSTGTLSTITNPGGSTRTFTYNSADLQLTMTDELSHVWSTAYDNLNRVTSETKPDPDGAGSLTAAVTSYSYNANGWLTEVIDALGNDTDYTYNSRGWVTQILRPDPDGAGSLSRPESTYQYDNVGNVIQEGRTQYTGGGVIARVYDDIGRLTSVTGPITNVGTSYTYDNLGRVTKESTMNTSEVMYVKYQYNSRGWVTRSIQAHPTDTFLIDGPATDFTYDAAGKMLTATDPRGYVTSWAYDQRGLVTALAMPDPDGASAGLVSPITNYAYDNVGRNTSITDPLGRVTTLGYDSRNRLTTVTQPDPDGAGSAASPVTTYAYNNASLRTSVTDPLSRVTSYAYDNANRLLTVTAPDPDGGGSLTSPVTTYAYNKMDSVTSITDPMGNVTSTTYDNLQRQTQVTAPDPDGGGSLTSPVTTYTYNAQGMLSQITDPLSHNTTFGYDDHGRRTTVTNHEGKVTTTAYDNLNRVTSVTTPDPDGAGSQTASVTSYTYDRWGQVTRITDPRNGQTNFTYDSVGNLLTLDDASGNTTTWTYDGLSRVITETNELNKTRAFSYDATSNLVRTFDRNGRVTRYGRDNLGRLAEETWYDGSTPPTASNITTTQGGPSNEVQRVGHTGASYGQFTLTYSGQTTANIAFNASAADVLAALEALSNIGTGDVAVTKTQNGPSTHEWQITFQGALAASNVSQITINTAGLMPSPTAIQTTDTQGSASNSEVQTVTISGATGGTFRLTFGIEQTSDLAYNASASTVETALEAMSGIDNVTVTGSAGGPYTITFGGTQSNTNVAQISADVTNLTNGTLSRTLSYSYDAASQLTAAEDADSEYAYTYDNVGRVLTVSNSGTSGVPTVVLTSAYNANSQRTSLSATIGGTNDFLNSYTYDNLNRLTRVDQTGNSGNTVANKRVDFEYNAIGQFSKITRQVKPSSTWNEVVTSTFTYDTLNRITALDHKHSTTDIANYDWTYDAMNRVTQLSSGDGTSDYTYDKESELTAADHSFQTDESYTYDSTGNRTNGSYSVGTNNRMTSDGTYNYTYDDEGNRLTRTKISDSSLTEYSWDHRNRLTKVVERASGAGQAITKQTDYKYDLFDRRISKSYDADGAGGGSAVVSRYVYDGAHIALQFDGSNSLTHRYLHGPAVDQILADENASNAILWPLTDNLGTVRDLVNDSGTAQNHFKYDSFGKVTAESNSAVDHLFAYTGRERDEETGLQYHRARYYDPAVGRWISHDPSSFAAGDSNLSRYVGNGSTNAFDSSGLSYSLANDQSATPMLSGASYAGWYQQQMAASIPQNLPPVLPAQGPAPEEAQQIMRAGGLLHAAEFLELPEAPQMRTDVVYALRQVDVIPQPTVHPEWTTTQHFYNQFMGILDNIPLGTTPLGSALAYYDVGTGKYHPMGSASEVANTIFGDTGIDTSSADYMTGSILGAIYMAILGAAAEEAIAAQEAGAAASTDEVYAARGGPGCFVAGTPVLMAPESDSMEATDAGYLSESYAWSIVVAGVGITALVVEVRKRRCKRSSVSRQDVPVKDRPQPNEDGQEDKDESVTDRLLTDMSWMRSAKSDERSGFQEVAASVAPVSSPCRSSRRSQTTPRYVVGHSSLLALACMLLAGALGLAFGTKHTMVPLTTVTSIARCDATEEQHFQAIESIKVGQRVLGENPTGEVHDSLGRDVDLATWRKLTLRAATLDGTYADVVLLRPDWWLDERHAAVGRVIPIAIPEVGIVGNATVLLIEPCPKIAASSGSNIAGSSRHHLGQPSDLYIEGHNKPDYVLCSDDRRLFARAAGETLIGSSELGVVHWFSYLPDEILPTGIALEVTGDIVTAVIDQNLGIPTKDVLGTRYVVDDLDSTDITPALWRVVELEMVKEDGSVACLTILRPLWWIVKTRASIGNSIDLGMQELGVSGVARVLRIGACTEASQKNGERENIISGKIVHRNAVVLDLVFNGDSSDPLGVTANHPIFSFDRSDWVPAGKLLIGERVRTTGEMATVTNMTPRAGRHTVYNIEVHRSHVYHVGHFRILAHNANVVDCGATNIYRGGESLTPKYLRSEVKIRDGMVQPTRGVSLELSVEDAGMHGAPYRIVSIPDELEIVQQGVRPGHHELRPKVAMSKERFEELLNQVVREPVKLLQIE